TTTPKQPGSLAMLEMKLTVASSFTCAVQPCVSSNQMPSCSFVYSLPADVTGTSGCGCGGANCTNEQTTTAAAAITISFLVIQVSKTARLASDRSADHSNYDLESFRRSSPYSSS